MKTLMTFLIAGLLLYSATARGTALAGSEQQNENKPQLQGPSVRDHGRTTVLIADEVRHHLVTLPFYGVFDWFESEVLPDNTVVLRGQVTRPRTKSDAEARVGRIESVAKVVNEIEVLPLSPNDDRLRLNIYQAIFKFDSPLFQYAVRAVPPIHIIVKNGRVTLKGVVANDMHRQLAYTAARGVADVFDVKNELVVENRS